MHHDTKSLLFVLFFLCSSLLFSQTNDTPLSFDEDIPFSLVSGYLFRGNEFFYEKTYNSVKKLSFILLTDCLSRIKFQTYWKSL